MNFHFYIIRFLALLSIIGLLSNCNQEEKYLFKQINPEHSGIHFNNQITESQDFSILNFHYIYNGGGVGIGDFNKDGLSDVVFTGNQVASQLYLNQGDLTFLDITEKSNFNSKGWATGVSIVDINADGWQDIYISVGGLKCDGNCLNQLFIHQGLDENGVPQFQEQAAQFGLEDGLYTQQAAFFDYDLDGDLDAYLLHNVIDKRDKNVPSAQKFINKKSKDILLENNGKGQFVAMSDSLGIDHRGYGLGIAINDFNQDNLPDIYIANDFLSNDVLYLNQGLEEGVHLGFKEVGKDKLKHTSYNAMGVDVADVNGDALPDIFVLDMLPEYNERQKTMLGFMNYNKFQLSLKQDYAPQFIRNTLQLHNGFLNNEILPFSEVGYLTGIYNTDWSWTPLLADFDNDGDRDLFVTNGYGKDITDLDFINYSQQRNPFGTKESQEKELYERVAQMEAITMPNYIFENQGDLNFKNQQDNWLKKQNSISNGAVYADLDNDGDLDLVVNNIDEKAYILENQIRDKNNTKNQNNYLKIKLQSKEQNNNAFGATVELWSDGQVQRQYHNPVRGYLSSVDNVIHFGLGKKDFIDSIKVIWVGGQIQTMSTIKTNQTLELQPTNVIQATTKPQQSALLFSADPTFSDYQHRENIHFDFDAQPLLLHQFSQQGPCLAVGNIDGKDGDELFIGGAKGESSQIFTIKNDQLELITTFSDAQYEDTDAAFFDIEGDGDLDLYVVSGGSEYLANDENYQDRIYLNDGKGQFTKVEMNLPRNSGSCIRAMDFDKDGDMDLFVGGRVVPRQYPQTPESYLLVNENGQFNNQTNKIAQGLKQIGMVTDAAWSDIDQDGWQDLVVVGEWMPIAIFKNEKGQLQTPDNYRDNFIENSAGMWNCIAAKDMDGDGDEDFIIGNLGENSRLKAASNEPLTLYKKDLDQNTSNDPFIGQFYLNKKGQKQCYPLHTRDDVMKQVTKLKNNFVAYAAFGQATFQEILKETNKEDFLEINQLQSGYLENKGNGQFELKALPKAAQFAPIQAIYIDDFDKDGHQDVLLSGNDYTCERNFGWYDAFNGLLLKGNGKGDFEAIPTAKSGFYVPNDGRDIVEITDEKGLKRILVGQNSGALTSFRARQYR